MDSILTSIKKLLGIQADYTHFDLDIIMHINTVFSILSQIGVGPAAGFNIQDETSKWSEYLGDAADLESVKTYVYLKVRMIFDPPTNNGVAESINRMISELESRISMTVDPGKEVNNV